MFCDNCGQPVREQARFCPECGAALGTPQPPPATPQEAAGAQAATGKPPEFRPHNGHDFVTIEGRTVVQRTEVGNPRKRRERRSEISGLSALYFSHGKDGYGVTLHDGRTAHPIDGFATQAERDAFVAHLVALNPALASGHDFTPAATAGPSVGSKLWKELGRELKNVGHAAAQHEQQKKHPEITGASTVMKHYVYRQEKSMRRDMEHMANLGYHVVSQSWRDSALPGWDVTYSKV